MDAVNISFDPDDIAECERAVRLVAKLIALSHGDVTVRRLFIAQTPAKRELRKHANSLLMINYVYFQLVAKLSAKRCAKMLADKNKSLPWGRRYGGGSTKQEALEKQIRREKKRMKADDRYREDVEESVAAILNVSRWKHRDMPPKGARSIALWEKKQKEMDGRERDKVRDFIAALLKPNGYRDGDVS